MSRQLTLLQELPAVPHRAHAHDGQPQLAQEQALQGGDSAGTLRCDMAGTSPGGTAVTSPWWHYCHRCHLPPVGAHLVDFGQNGHHVASQDLAGFGEDVAAQGVTELGTWGWHRDMRHSGTRDTQGHGTLGDTGHSGTQDARGHGT